MKDQKIKNLSPLKSIRLNCLECSNQQPALVRECNITDCPLWKYRFGKNPRRKGIKKGFGTNTQTEPVNSEIAC